MREVNRILGELPSGGQGASNAVFDSDSHVTAAMKALLNVEHKLDDFCVCYKTVLNPWVNMT